VRWTGDCCAEAADAKAQMATASAAPSKAATTQDAGLQVALIDRVQPVLSHPLMRRADRADVRDPSRDRPGSGTDRHVAVGLIHPRAATPPVQILRDLQQRHLREIPLQPAEVKPSTQPPPPGNGGVGFALQTAPPLAAASGLAVPAGGDPNVRAGWPVEAGMTADCGSKAALGPNAPPGAELSAGPVKTLPLGSLTVRTGSVSADADPHRRHSRVTAQAGTASFHEPRGRLAHGCGLAFLVGSSASGSAQTARGLACRPRAGLRADRTQAVVAIAATYSDARALVKTRNSDVAMRLFHTPPGRRSAGRGVRQDPADMADEEPARRRVRAVVMQVQVDAGCAAGAAP
jgi:hypothetical protein